MDLSGGNEFLMTIFQQYYTSFKAPEGSGKQSGFGIQAETRGMPEALQEKIKVNTGYRYAASVPIKAIDQHPIALRFQTVNGQGILTCVRASGTDDQGRDGNYFAHTLVGRIEKITSVRAPIFYWKSDFWVKEDTTHYVDLPSLPNMNVLPINFDSDKLWDFINQGNRRAWLQKMLCAVVDFGRSKRPIIILDTNEAIAQWIACVTLAIPPAYYNLLSFATYHHDPNRAPFMLIGTTRDSNFRFDNDEYTRYFILNAEDKRVSDAPPSDYAEFVAQRFDQHQYNTDIAEFFIWQKEYEAIYTRIGTHLNDVINFRKVTFYRTLSRESEQAIHAAGQIIQVNQAAPLSMQRLEDLYAATEIISTVALNNSNTLKNYLQALETLKAVDQAGFLKSSTTTRTAFLLAQLIVQKRNKDAESLLRRADSLFGAETFTEALHNPDVLSLLAQKLDPQDIQQHALLWKTLDGRLKVSFAQLPIIRSLLSNTFSVFGGLGEASSAPPENVHGILSNILSNISSMDDFSDALRLAEKAKQGRSPSNPALEWLYYTQIGNLSLTARRDQGYWQLWKAFSSLFTFELNSDLARAGKVDDAVVTVNKWCVELSPESRQQTVSQALNYLWQQPQIAKKQLAQTLLLHPTLGSYLSPDSKQKLVESVLTDAEIALVDNQTAQLYERYLTPNLAPALLGAIEGSLALIKQSLTSENASSIRARLAGLNEPKYRDEAQKLISHFFATSKDIVNHHWLLIYTTYIDKNKTVFWELYWAQMETEILQNRKTDQIAEILNFWFKDIAYLGQQVPTIVPEFFLELAGVLTNIRDSKDFRNVENYLKKSLSRYPWYPMVQKYLVKQRRGGLFG
jgi:hypothetical protein